MDDETIEDPADSPILKTERRSGAREMLSLIKSAKESKIIKEFTEIPNQKRRSRRDLTKIPKKKRRTSTKEYFTKQKVNAEKRSSSVCRMSTEVGPKPDKKSFYLPVQTSPVNAESKPLEKSKRRSSCPEINLDNGSKNDGMQSFILITKNSKGQSIDPFCWRCHKSRTHINCSICPKAFHIRCLPNKLPDLSEWTCIECAELNRYFFCYSTFMNYVQE
ncbi:uncharacterized protein LOC143922148 [Arctopsyche grandis]|uniref:uncharacterized protein LOC143922148 n=1 Tax=Arctopsyche grandis TaxID=121162 RepID=UPI00406D83D9